MEIPKEILNIIRRSLLALTLLMIVSSVSSTRVKRETRDCTININCNTVPNVDRFRTIDGTCNNRNNPLWGASDIPHIRYIERTPLGSAFRCPTCPRPRDVSYAMNNLCLPDHNDGITVMVMQWGQFTDHDLTFTPEFNDTACCQNFNNPTPTSSACVPIDVTNDPFYRSLSRPVTCLPFVRSRPSTCATLESRNRETFNELTSYLDGSQIYGSNKVVGDGLRTFVDGKLKTSDNEPLACTASTVNVCPRSLLPVRDGTDGEPEFFAGDTRVEEQPSLTSIHTLFVRLHNHIASILKISKKCGPDEITFQTARKIVGAIVQQITFNEFLPIIVGPKMDDNLYQLGLNFKYSYNPTVSATTPNVFATAVFRFGHSLIPNVFQTTGVPVQLERSFENHHVTLNPNSFPSHFVGGIIGQDAMPMDQMVVQAIHNKLFAEGPNFDFGSDLYARNIQRGRDHGIPGYIEWYNYCVNYNPQLIITSFGDLYGLMPSCVVNQFRSLYNRVEDIDLFPAGVAEFEVPGGILGPTFSCIIAQHFSNIKFGDRFWFQNPGYFTSAQVASIQKTRLSSIICKHTNVQKIQPLVLEVVSDVNPLFPCDSNTILTGVLNDLESTIWNGIC